MLDLACDNFVDGLSCVHLGTECSHNLCECVQLEMNSCQV